MASLASSLIFSACICCSSCSEALFLEQAELMVAMGFRDLGYVHVNIDVSWRTDKACTLIVCPSGDTYG